MNFDSPILFFICSLGVFNGVLIAVYFLILNRQKRLQNLLFGLLVLLLSIRIGKSVYILFTPHKELNFWLLQIGLTACFLIGVVLLYYLKASIKNIKKIPESWKIHVTVLAFIIMLIGIVKPYPSNVDFWLNYVIHFIYATWGAYILLSAFVLKNSIKKLFDKQEKMITSELWLIWVFIGNALIFSAYLMGYYHIYVLGTITFSIVFYGLLFFFLFKKNRETIFRDIPEKYSAKKIDEHEARHLLKQLEFLMQDKELYKSSEIKLQNVAKEINTTSHKLSQLVNDNLGKSFNGYVNDYRIKEAKRLLRENSQYTLEAIAFEAGFSSKSNFYATFKKVVGQTPSKFRKRTSQSKNPGL